MFPLISIAAAFAVCGFLLYLGGQSVEADIKDEPRDVVVTGDSIIGKEREDGTVEEYFEKYSGLTMVNGAFGGNCASVGENAGRYSYQGESITLPELAEAICYRDFGVQRADLAISQTKIEYFEESLQNLAEVDFRQTKILMLAFGTNDYLSGKKTDDPADPYNVETYGGALRYGTELIKKTYPDLEIVLVTPLFCHISGWENCLEQSFYGGETLDKYVETEKRIAEQYGLYVIDAFGEAGIDETNYEEYMEEGGLHLNREGREKYARFLAEKTKELLKEISE